MCNRAISMCDDCRNRIKKITFINDQFTLCVKYGKMKEKERNQWKNV